MAALQIDPPDGLPEDSAENRFYLLKTKNKSEIGSRELGSSKKFFDEQDIGVLQSSALLQELSIDEFKVGKPGTLNTTWNEYISRTVPDIYVYGRGDLFGLEVSWNPITDTNVDETERYTENEKRWAQAYIDAWNESLYFNKDYSSRAGIDYKQGDKATDVNPNYTFVNTLINSFKAQILQFSTNEDGFSAFNGQMGSADQLLETLNKIVNGTFSAIRNPGEDDQILLDRYQLHEAGLPVGSIIDAINRMIGSKDMADRNMASFYAIDQNVKNFKVGIESRLGKVVSNEQRGLEYANKQTGEIYYTDTRYGEAPPEDATNENYTISPYMFPVFDEFRENVFGEIKAGDTIISGIQYNNQLIKNQEFTSLKNTPSVYESGKYLMSTDTGIEFIDIDRIALDLLTENFLSQTNSDISSLANQFDPVDSDISSLATVITTIDSDVSSLAVAGGDVDLSPVDSDISSLATVITTIDSDVSSLAVAGGDVDLSPVDSDISSLATVITTIDSDVSSLAVAGGDVDLSPVDSDISSLATVITTIDSDVSSLAVAGGGSVDLNPLNSDISSLATVITTIDSDVSSLAVAGGDVDLSRVDSDISSLATVITTIDSDVSSLAVAGGDVDLSRVDSDISSLATVITTIDSDVSSLAVAGGDVDLSRVDSDISSLATVITTIDSDVSSLAVAGGDVDLSPVDSDISSLATVITTIDSDVSSLAVAGGDVDLSPVDSDISSLATVITTIDSDVSSLAVAGGDVDLSPVDSDISSLATVITTIDSDVSSLAVAGGDVDLSPVDSDISSLATVITTIDSDVSSLAVAGGDVDLSPVDSDISSLATVVSSLAVAGGDVDLSPVDSDISSLATVITTIDSDVSSLAVAGGDVDLSPVDSDISSLATVVSSLAVAGGDVDLSPVDSDISSLATVITTIDSDVSSLAVAGGDVDLSPVDSDISSLATVVSSLAVAGGDVDLSPVDSDISSLATVITTIDSDVSSLAVAGGGSVDLNPLNSDISSLATASSLSSFGEADVVAYLDGNLDTHIIPNANATYDIGSAEYKIRHFYLSDNSLKFVDGSNQEYSLGVSNNVLTFNGEPVGGDGGGGGSAPQTNEYLSVSRTSYDVTNEAGNASQMQAFEFDLSTTNKIEIKPKEGYPNLWINFENLTLDKFYIVEILITGDPIYMFNFNSLLNIDYALNKEALPSGSGSKQRKSSGADDGGYPDIYHQQDSKAILIQLGFQIVGGSITIHVDPSRGTDIDPNTDGVQHAAPFYNTNGDKFFTQDFHDAYSTSSPYYVLDENGNQDIKYTIYTYAFSKEIAIFDSSGGSMITYNIDDFTVVNKDQEDYVIEMTLETEPSWTIYEDYRYFRDSYPQYGISMWSSEVATPR